MLNRREREVVDRLDRVMREIGSLNPSNPADVRAKATNLSIATSAAKRLAEAIGALRAGDWLGVERALGEAERIVARDTRTEGEQ